jgi:hypothetical protein
MIRYRVARAVTICYSKCMATSKLHPPAGFREGTQYELACPHRDLSCCPECAAAHPEINEVYGIHYWSPETLQGDGTHNLDALIEEIGGGA